MVRVFLLNVAPRRQATLNKKKPGPPKNSVLFLGFEVSAFRVHVQGVPTVSLARVDVGGRGAAVHFRFWGFRLQGSALGVYNSGRLFVQTHNENTPTTLRCPNFGAKPLDLRGQPIIFFFLHVFTVLCLAPCGQSRSQPKSVAAKVDRATSPRERAESARESAQSPPTRKNKNKNKKEVSKKKDKQRQKKATNKKSNEKEKKKSWGKHTRRRKCIRFGDWFSLRCGIRKTLPGFTLQLCVRFGVRFRLQGIAFGVYSSGLAFVFQHTMKTHPPTLWSQIIENEKK